MASRKKMEPGVTRVVGRTRVIGTGETPPGGIIDFRGQLLAGRFRVEKLLADVLAGVRQGGEAHVYYGRDTEEDREVVIKMYRLPPRGGMKKLEALAKLKHENLLPILACGEAGGLAWEVQPLALGGTLAAGPLDGKPCPPATLRLVAGSVAAALQMLHAQRFVHRDIKPSNIYWMDHGRTRVALADYGIVSLVEDDGTHVTITGSGTTGYSAPEIYANRALPESDWFSLGLTLLELATGRSQFAGLNPLAIQALTTAGTIMIPDDFDNDLRNLLEGLLVKEYRHRFGAAEVFEWAAGRAVRPPRVRVGKRAGDGEDRLARVFEVPFSFGSRQVATLGDLVRAMRDEPEQAVKYLRRWSIPVWIRGEGMHDPALISLADTVQDLAQNEEDDELVVFRSIYAIEGRPRFLGCLETPEEVAAYIEEHRESLARTLFD